ncbi:MAG: hypothetical protein CMH57_11480 [Myxococcales bacterium]|nr:hypothetical protein [Myxococcales bacterium]
MDGTDASNHTRAAAASALLLMALAAGCQDEPDEARPDPRLEPVEEAAPQVEDVGAALAEDATTSEREHSVVAPASDVMFDWIATHCHVDEVGFSGYSKAWMGWVYRDDLVFNQFMPPEAPRPKFRPWTFPMEGSPEAAERVEAIREAWFAEPGSHIVDCRFSFERRDCPDCVPLKKRGLVKHGGFIAYIPEALLTEPERVRSLLLLIPGARGGRARYFLTPIPGKSVKDFDYGGLEVKRHLDELIKAHPEYSPPLVVAIDHAGWTTANGPIEFITHDVMRRVVDNFLGGVQLDRLAVGADGISAGARASVMVAARHPDLLNTIGLVSTHCGHAGLGGGVSASYFGETPEEQARLLDELVERHREGLFHLRMVQGNRDNWECMKSFQQVFVDAGMFPDQEPALSDCRDGHDPGPNWCRAVWPGLELVRDHGHGYEMLLPIWRRQLQWQLEALTSVVSTIDRQADE